MPNYTITGEWKKLSEIMGSGYLAGNKHRVHVNPTSDWVYYSDDSALPTDAGSCIREFQEVILSDDNYLKATDNTVVNISTVVE